MYHLRFAVLMLAVVVLAGPGAFSQDKKDTPKDPVKGQLPTYWKQLGLSADQTQEVYTIQARYKSEIQKLEDQVVELKAKQRKELEKVLTPAQRARLKEIIASKAGLSEDKDEKPKSKEDKTKSK